ncbi:MAG: efflux RND transporter periplasmic adaptor subunit [Oscillospiraceae bacterium]|nr:efflux RND transporter periplasmic adaptor subunit [Oscillospiraceae bacterium]
MKKRIFAVLTSAVLMCSLLCACGDEATVDDEIYIPINTGSVNYNTADAYVGTILETVTLDGTVDTPYYTNLSFSLVGGTITEFNVHEDQTVSEGDVLVRLSSDELDDEIEVQKVVLDSAQSTYDALVAAGDEDEAALAAIDLAIEQANYDNLVKRLDYLTITAPCDGKITSVGNYWVGATVSANSTVCTIVDSSKVYLTVTDNQNQLSNVSFGTKVDIAQGTLVVTTGKVIDTITTTSYDRFSGESNTITSYVIQPDEDVDFEDFGTIQVTFTTLRRDDAVIVPTDAVFETSDGYAVNVLISGTKVQMEVTVGIISGDKTEILSGLDGTETIIL